MEIVKMFNMAIKITLPPDTTEDEIFHLRKRLLTPYDCHTEMDNKDVNELCGGIGMYITNPEYDYKSLAVGMILGSFLEKKKSPQLENL